jgi:hypothetical protein
MLWAGACGRIGVHLLPQSHHDAGPADAGLHDAGPTDSGARDSGPADAGTDAAAYNGCAVECRNDHGTAECSDRSCTLNCAIGYEDCDGDAANGCELSTLDTSDHCGSCGMVCENAHGDAACSQGLCKPACASGFADCDGNAANGCETELSGTGNCGACARTCSNAHGGVQCTAGQCAPACAAGYEDCDGDPTNGCETDVSGDPKHCGSCTNTCDPSSEVCTAGQCKPSPCTAGRGECDNDPTVNCETDLTSSVAHCGFCEDACTAANGTPQCSASTCGVASCNSGYADCDGAAANGCEVPLATTTAHCGACATACTNAHGTTSCAASTCKPVCSAGYGDCDTSRINGCERALNTVSDCGMCGRACPANGGTPQCNSGVCTTACNVSGAFALKVSVPATWPSTSVLSSGSGTFVMWLLVQLTQNGTSLTGNVTPCGQTVPDFKAAAFINETYGVTYPTTIFDRTPLLPSVAATATLGSTAPGASFSMAKTAWVAGVTLSNPATDPWPSESAVVATDSDADGKPGVTATYKSGSGYSSPPTNSLGSSRASRDYLATRIAFSLSGTLTSCTQASGTATVPDIDFHTVGCRLTSNSDCNSSATSYLDSNAPNYQTGSGSFSMAKLTGGAACSDVRTALP